METVTAAEVVTRVRAGDDVAHLFTQGPGWTRCRCRRVAWSAALMPAPAGAPICPECRAIQRELEEIAEIGF